MYFLFFIFFQQKAAKHFHMASFSVQQWHSAGWLLCQSATMKAFLAASPRLLPIERVLCSPSGTEQLNRFCQNVSFYNYLTMHKAAIPLAFSYANSESFFLKFKNTLSAVWLKVLSNLVDRTTWLTEQHPTESIRKSNPAQSWQIVLSL